MAKKRLTENQLLVLLRAHRGDIDRYCDLSACTRLDGSVGQDIAYLQTAKLLGGSQFCRNTAADLCPLDAGNEMVAKLLAATEH